MLSIASHESCERAFINRRGTLHPHGASTPSHDYGLHCNTATSASRHIASRHSRDRVLVNVEDTPQPRGANSPLHDYSFHCFTTESSSKRNAVVCVRKIHSFNLPTCPISSCGSDKKLGPANQQHGATQSLNGTAMAKNRSVGYIPKII